MAKRQGLNVKMVSKKAKWQKGRWVIVKVTKWQVGQTESGYMAKWQKGRWHKGKVAKRQVGYCKSGQNAGGSI